MFRFFDSIAATFESLFLLIGRLGIAALYAPSGWGKLMNLQGFSGNAAVKDLPMPMAWAVVIALLELVGGIAIGLGFKMRPFALALAIFTVIAALLAHAFWAVPEAAYTVQRIMFFKNMAIAGGLLILFARGTGAISLDRS